MTDHDPNGPPACPDAIALAAHLDGRDGDAAGRDMEAHLARCPACREAVDELRTILAESPDALAFVPAATLEAARALVPARTPARAPSRRRWVPAWAAARAGLAAAASVVVCIVGYRTGFAAQTPPAAEVEVVAEMSFGMISSSDASDDAYELLMLGLEPLDAGGTPDAEVAP
jgi:anti-sigma factor RsiW